MLMYRMPDGTDLVAVGQCDTVRAALARNTSYLRALLPQFLALSAHHRQT
jgi:hypothetical protein